jgi:hypothetical protein
MSETEVVAEQVPAPEPVATAAPEPEVVAQEAVQPEEKPAKTFSQEELDALVGKRLARERRKWEREQALKAPEPKVQTPATLPDRDVDPDAYAEALAARKAEELLAQREVERQQRELLTAYKEREEAAFEKYDDFEQIVYNKALPITNVMAETIQASELGPDVAYYLGSNPREAERISRLSPYLQAKEIGKIEVRLADNPPVKRTTNAPPPIKPVTAKTVGAPARDTTDPRSVKDMSTSEWIEAERLRQIKQWEARRNR